MSIKEKRKVEKKNGMKVTDNMDGEKKANEKLMAKYEPGSNISDFKYERSLGIPVILASNFPLAFFSPSMLSTTFIPFFISSFISLL